MKSAHWLLLGAGAFVLLRCLSKRKAQADGLGQQDLVPPTPPNWYNTGLTPIGYEAAGWHPPDEWKKFAQRRAELRAQGLGQSEWEPFTSYPLSAPIYQAPFPYAMPYAQSFPTTYVETIEWKTPHMKDVTDEWDPF